MTDENNQYEDDNTTVEASSTLTEKFRKNLLISTLPMLVLLLTFVGLASIGKLDIGITALSSVMIIIATIAAIGIQIILSRHAIGNIISRLTIMHKKMDTIAEGDFETDITDCNPNDEIGAIGDVLQKFKDHAMEKALLDEMLETTNEMLRRNSALIEESIMYARKIQQNTMADRDLLSSRFKDHHLIWNPRDLVGGDFFLCYELPNDDFVLIIGDCTGHGVPGAMLTMLVSAISSLVMYDLDFDSLPDEIPGRVLSQLHHHMQAALRQDSGKKEASDEGLEACVVYLPKGKSKIYSAGARHSMVHAGLNENNEVQEIIMLPAEKKSLAYSRYDSIMEFESYEIDLTLYPRNLFYSLSDGVVDQVGSEIRRAYGKKRIMKFIEDNAHLSPKEQGAILANDMVIYMGDESQRDDQTVFIFEALQE